MYVVCLFVLTITFHGIPKSADLYKYPLMDGCVIEFRLNLRSLGNFVLVNLCSHVSCLASDSHIDGSRSVWEMYHDGFEVPCIAPKQIDSAL
jgi:hypothetical protein